MRIIRAKTGNALILTMFIMAGMLIVAISSSYIVVLGIKAGGIQAQSTKAYFVAEAGAEKLLWELNNGFYIPDYDPPLTPIAENELGELSLDGSFQVFQYFDSKYLFRSIGSFGNTKRSVEL
jgi:hypothetical protein